MKHLLTFFVIFSSLSTFSRNKGPCNGNWVYLDLGNTIVDTRDGIDKIKYMPGAKKYINTLRRAGCRLGLITNIPESWGDTYSEKMRTFTNFIRKGWIEERAFNWKDFSKIYIPRNDKERKPEPLLFQVAQMNAWAQGKKAIYQGENAEEVRVSNELGMRAFQVGSRSGSFYLPLKEVLRGIK